MVSPEAASGYVITRFTRHSGWRAKGLLRELNIQNSKLPAALCGHKKKFEIKLKTLFFLVSIVNLL
jgi:hypothetical protein